MRKLAMCVVMIAGLLAAGPVATARDYVTWTSCTTSDVLGTGEPAPGSPPALRTAAAPHGLRIGSAINNAYAQRGPLWETAAREFNHLTIENTLKWTYVHPARDEYEFCYADTVAEFAQANGQTIHGTTMVWHGASNPPYIRYGKSGTCEDAGNQDIFGPCVPWSRDEMLQFLREHIFTVMHHYRDNFPGIITEWEIANEVIADCETPQPCPGGDVLKSPDCPSGPCPLRESIWKRWVGDDYLDYAFRYAREADPNVKLYINEYWVETPTNKPKLDALLNLVAGMKARGVPIDGIGFQSHINVFDGPLDDKDFPTTAYLSSILQRAVDLDVDVAVTELDVAMGAGIALTPQLAGRQAMVYRNFLDACLAQPRCRTFIMWGFDDANHWEKPDLPTIYDALYRPKMAYHALRSGLLESTSERVGETFVRHVDQMQQEGGGAFIGNGWSLRQNGATSKTQMPLSGRTNYEAVVVARGVPLAGVWPEFDVKVDGVTVGHVVADSPVWTTYAVPFTAGAGTHDLAITYTNGADGRALDLQTLSAVGWVEAEYAHTRTSGTSVCGPSLARAAIARPGRSDRGCWTLSTAGYVQNSFVVEDRYAFDTLLPVQDVVIVASGTLAPMIEVRIDGVAVGTVTVTSGTPSEIRLSVPIAPGMHDVALAYINPGAGRSLTLDRYSVTAALVAL